MCVWTGPRGELFHFANAAQAAQAHGPWLFQLGWVFIAGCRAAARGGLAGFDNITRTLRAAVQH